MANTTNSSNMNLPIPIVSQDPGPQWGFDNNSCLTIIDAHDHSTGLGVAITPSGMNINTDLPFGSNNATALRSTRFTSQSAALALGTDLRCLYAVSADLYYNDGAGNQIRITQSGGISGSPGSIASLASPASASYNAGTSTFIWQSAANTPAKMDGGSYIFRNLSANSNGITMAAPNALGSNYTIVLPALPGSTSALNISSSGNMGTITYDGIGSAMTSTGANAIAATMTSTGSNAIAASMSAAGADAVLSTADASLSIPAAGANKIIQSTSRTVSATPSLGQVGLSASCNIFTTASTSYVDVTGLSLNLPTSGRPILIMLASDGTAGSNLSIFNGAGGAQSGFSLKILNGATIAYEQIFPAGTTVPAASTYGFSGSQFGAAFIAPAAGTQQLKVQVKCLNTLMSCEVEFIQLIAFEIS